MDIGSQWESQRQSVVEGGTGVGKREMERNGEEMEGRGRAGLRERQTERGGKEEVENRRGREG